MDVIYFIGILCAVWLFVEGAESIDFLKELLNVHKKTKSKKVVIKVLAKLLNCALCSGFWVGLIYYQSFEMGCLVSVSSEVFKRLVEKFLSNGRTTR